MWVWWLSVASMATFITFTVCSPRGRSAPVSGMIVPIFRLLEVKPWLGSEFVAHLLIPVLPPVVPPVPPDDPLVPPLVPPDVPPAGAALLAPPPVVPTFTTPPFESDVLPFLASCLTSC